MNPVDALLLALPLYLLVLLGFVLARRGMVAPNTSEAMSRFVFVVAIPAMLFQITSDFANMPPVDYRLLFPYFLACLIVFIIARVVAAWRFGQDGAGQTVFAMACIYGNTVLLGVSLAKSVLGNAAVPALALILVAHTIFMWTLATVSYEWSKGGRPDPKGLLKMLHGVITNPVIASILLGVGFSLTGLPMPAPLQRTLDLLGQSAVPVALVTVGIGLAAYRLREGLPIAIAISTLKLVVLPFFVWALARLIGLPALEMSVVMLLSSIALGVNAYLMSREFGALGGPVSTALLLSTVISVVSTPLVIALFPPG